MRLIVKIAIIAIPTYTIAILTEQMVYTIPMLVITSLIAQSAFKIDEESDSVDSE